MIVIAASADRRGAHVAARGYADRKSAVHGHARTRGDLVIPAIAVDGRARVCSGYLLPLPGNGIRSTSVVAGRRRASSTGMKCPVRESRPRRLLCGGLGGALLFDMIKSLSTLKRKKVEYSGVEPDA